MIKANHKKYAEWIFIPYMNRILKKNFSHFYLVNKIPEIPVNAGIVVTPNHISWWDGFFAKYLFTRDIDRKFHIMMLEVQLRKYRFFSKLGAYSIDPGNIRSVFETSRYTSELVSNPANFVITYPQGEIQSFEKRPLKLKEGLRIFTRDINGDFLILPVGFKIHYYNEKHPAVIARYGNPIKGTKIFDDYDAFERDFTNNLDQLADAAENMNFVGDLFER